MNPVSREIAADNLSKFYAGFYRRLGDENLSNRMDEKVIDFDYDARTITIEFAIREWMLNYMNILHGGLYAMIADMTCGALAYILCDTNPPTVELSLHYLSPAKAGDTVVGKARATHVGRNNINILAELYSKNTGKLLATCTDINFVGGPKHHKED